MANRSKSLIIEIWWDLLFIFIHYKPPSESSHRHDLASVAKCTGRNAAIFAHFIESVGSYYYLLYGTNAQFTEVVITFHCAYIGLNSCQKLKQTYRLIRRPKPRVSEFSVESGSSSSRSALTKWRVFLSHHEFLYPRVNTHRKQKLRLLRFLISVH